MKRRIKMFKCIKDIVLPYGEVCFKKGKTYDLYTIGLEFGYEGIDEIETKALQESIKKQIEDAVAPYKAFYDYFQELYGQGLEVANWHQNGDLESFDNFFESAEMEMK